VGKVLGGERIKTGRGKSLLVLQSLHSSDWGGGGTNTLEKKGKASIVSPQPLVGTGWLKMGTRTGERLIVGLGDERAVTDFTERKVKKRPLTGS